MAAVRVEPPDAESKQNRLRDLSGDSSSWEYRALSPDWPPFYTPYTLSDIRGSRTVADGTESVTLNHC